MGFFDDFKSAVEAYPTGSCKTEIVNFSIINGGATLQVGETFQFRVKVTNEGHLDMKNVTVQALGTAFADVGLSNAPPYGGSAVSGAFDLDADGNSHTTGYFRGKCKAVTNGPKDIVTARISAWDASLDHILKDHSRAGANEGKLTGNITPD